MVKRTTVAIMCLALLLAALPAFEAAQAQPGQGKGRRGGPDESGLYPGCPLNIDLTQEQSTKLQDICNAFFKDTAGLRSDIFKKEQDMDVLMLEKTIAVEKVKTIQDEISGLRSQFAQKRLQAQLEARKVLTPEQIAQLPPGCNMGIGPGGGRGCGFGAGGGRGPRDGSGRGQGSGGW
ncbi:MAG: periplasmic heavy metal sensor [Deltaproteobacteria bacterium]|nr:periplasmic heavy metal sensor [Deltaproteobacteria bacterium]